MSEGPTWQLLAAAATSITGVLLLAAAFSPENPAPTPAILGSGALMLAFSLVLLRLHLRLRREQG